MSGQTVEIVRRALEAHSRMDADALVALCDPAVEYQSRITAVDEVAYQGHDGIRRYITRLAEVFDLIDVKPLQVLEDNDRVVVTARFCARGRGGGVEVEQRFFVAIKLRDGKLVRWEVYGSKHEALEAAGLPEKTLTSWSFLLRAICGSDCGVTRDPCPSCRAGVSGVTNETLSSSLASWSLCVSVGCAPDPTPRNFQRQSGGPSRVTTAPG